MASVTTPLGEIKGVDLEGCERYAGIRYAKAPVGERRFLPPEPVDAWDGVYDATSFGASAPQAVALAGAVGGVGRDQQIDEDCLFLNVYTPAADGGARPVMVWIHGGAYTIGSGDLYDGVSFVRRGDVVVVTLNYRLGVLGWTPVDHLDPSLTGSGNNGLRDQIEALRWVRDNIASFGGDPSNVTIFGESAGGGSVAAILCAPSADGLYHKAIIQSGAANIAAASANPGRYADDVLAAIGKPDGGIEALRAATPEELVAAVAKVGLIERLGRDAEHPIDGSGDGPHPIVDGVVVTRGFAEALASKGADNVPLIIGTNLDEGTLFGMLLPKDVTDDELVGSIGPTASDPAAVLAAVKAAATGRPALVDLMTDAIFRIPSLRGADAQAATGVPVWVYLFTWKTPVFGGMLGATHALEIPFVWNMVADPTWSFLVGEKPPMALAEAMQDAWLSFARTGRPGADWPEYDTVRRPTMEFGESVRVVDDPGRDLRLAWYAES